MITLSAKTHMFSDVFNILPGISKISVWRTIKDLNGITPIVVPSHVFVNQIYCYSLSIDVYKRQG